MTRELLIENFNKYPQMQIEDVFKFLHQSCYGCGHLLSEFDIAAKYIKDEYDQLSSVKSDLITSLDGEYARVDLGYISKGLDINTLAKLFYISASKNEDGKKKLEQKLETLEKMIEEELLPFDKAQFLQKLELWKSKAYCAIHHSEAYRKEYSPSYRVISDRYIPFLPLFAEIDKRLKKGSLFLAIEGGSASGKSTLGKMLTEIYDCTLFRMDDYFLRPEQRTAERLNEPGGNVDRERFLEEILIPASKGERVKYRPYNCTKRMLDDEITADITPLTVTEGAYSTHPELRGYYDMTVFLDISAEKQRERVIKRDPFMAERFFNEWIPLEQKYFDAFDVKARCDLCIEIN